MTENKRNALIGTLATVGLLAFAAYGYFEYMRDTVKVGSAGSAPSIMAAASYDNPAATAPTTATPPPTATPAKPAAKPLTKAEEFALLTAKDATPAMLSKAWYALRDCQNEAAALAGGVQTAGPPRCQLPPGTWKDAQTIKRILEARAARADFGAVSAILAERFGAYADDPAAWRKLLADADRISKERSEPTAMFAEFNVSLEQGKALQAAGRMDEAREAYRAAGAYAVAHAIGRIWEDGKYAGQPSVNVAPDIAADSSVQAVWPLLSKAEQSQAITAGKALANKWRTPS